MTNFTSPSLDVLISQHDGTILALFFFFFILIFLNFFASPVCPLMNVMFVLIDNTYMAWIPFLKCVYV